MEARLHKDSYTELPAAGVDNLGQRPWQCLEVDMYAARMLAPAVAGIAVLTAGVAVLVDVNMEVTGAAAEFVFPAEMAVAAVVAVMDFEIDRPFHHFPDNPFLTRHQKPTSVLLRRSPINQLYA